METWKEVFKLLIKNIIYFKIIFKKGANDVKTHRWFSEIDWEQLISKGIPAPYKPAVKQI